MYIFHVNVTVKLSHSQEEPVTLIGIVSNTLIPENQPLERAELSHPGMG